MRDYTLFQFSEFDKTTWRCEICREIGESERRGCGALKDYPVLMIKGKKLYRCPVGLPEDIRLLFGYLSATASRMIAPPEPSIFWLSATKIFLETIAEATTKEENASDGKQKP